MENPSLTISPTVEQRQRKVFDISYHVDGALRLQRQAATNCGGLRFI